MLAAVGTPGTTRPNPFASENIMSIAAFKRKLHSPLVPIAVRSHCVSSTEMQSKGRCKSKKFSPQNVNS